MNALGVAVHSQIRLGGDGDGDLGGGQAGLGGGVLEQGADLEHAALQGDGARLQAGQVKELGDQVAEARSGATPERLAERRWRGNGRLAPSFF